MKQRTERVLCALRAAYRRFPSAKHRVPARPRGDRSGFFGKTIFRKYFFACAFVLLVSISILGTAVTVASVRITNAQHQRLNSTNASRVAQLIGAEYDYMNSRTMQAYLFIFSQSSDSTAMVVDTTGRPVQIADTQHLVNMQGTVPKSVISSVTALKTGEVYSAVGDLSGLLSRSALISAAPVTDALGDPIAVVFICSGADSMYWLVSRILNVFIICSLAVLLLAFVLISYITSRMVRPLREMSVAARNFAKGDFTLRVPVHGKDEIAQLASSFNNMAASLSSLEDMRRSFVANVSHELKTPMTSIAGFIDGILDGTIPQEQQRHYLQMVSDEVKRLSRLVRSFLDIANIEAGKLRVNKTEFDAAETVRRVLIGFERKIDDKGLDIRTSGLEDGIPVRDDPDLTHQILYNLIENAVKFADEHGTVEVTAARSGSKIFVGIRNTGVGIPSGDIPYVFDRFYKTDKSRGLDKTGVGIGLYIVKSVLGLMGEDITVRSVEGSYCEFIFTLTPAQ